VDAELFGCPGAVSTVALQCLDEQIPFRQLQLSPWRFCGGAVIFLELEKILWEAFCGDSVARTEDKSPLDDVLQLPDIAGEGITHEQGQGLVLHICDGPVRACLEAMYEVLNQQILQRSRRVPDPEWWAGLFGILTRLLT